MIPTYITETEAAELRRLATGRAVLELGTQWGYSGLEMAQTAEVVVTVDWHLGDPDSGEMDTLGGFVTNLRSRHGLGNLVPVVGRIEEVLPLLRPASFSMLFHDAGHDERSLRRDLGLALPLLRFGSVIAVHDWGLFGVRDGTANLLGPPNAIIGRLATWRLWPGR